MHPHIADLGKRLLALLDNPMTQPKKSEYDAVMVVKDELRRIDTGAEKFSPNDITDLQGLIVMAYKRLNQIEDFLEKNNYKWAA